MVIIHYNIEVDCNSLGEMMFIKRGDVKILSVIETDELSEEQKSSAKKLSEENVKQSNSKVDVVLTKELGSN